MSKQPQDEFPDCFIQYAREKLRVQRDTIEYDARFGPPFLKSWALMILVAGGDKESNIGKRLDPAEGETDLMRKTGYGGGG